MSINIEKYRRMELRRRVGNRKINLSFKVPFHIRLPHRNKQAFLGFNKGVGVN